jgi:predicted alpha/beta superfamily hydrolase
MKTATHHYYLLAIVLLIYQNTANAQTTNPVEAFPKVALERTEVRSLHSQTVDQDYELSISLPRSYNLGNSSYPLIIILDAYRSFSIIKGYIDVITFPFKTIPEVILVGIGYGGDESTSAAKWAAGRTRDLTPVQDSGTEKYFESILTEVGFEAMDIQTGGASLLLDFIRNELFPYLSSKYRVDMENKVLYGYSFGGLFALYTLFHAPETFDKYLVGSPSIHYKDGVTFEYEANYAKSHSDLDADVFMSSGGLEEGTRADVKKMESLIISRNYPGLKLETVIFENESHISCSMAAISRGFIELFNNDE